MKNRKILFVLAAFLFAILLLVIYVLFGGGQGGDSSVGGQPSVSAESVSPSENGDSSQRYVFNFGHGGSEKTAQQAGALAMKEYIESNSGGRIKINVYPNNQIGNDRELCESVQDGTLAMCLANSVQVNFVSDATIYDLYFRFQSIDEVIGKFRNDENFFNTMSAKYADAGYKLTGFSVHGFRQVTANKPIRTPADFSGLAFRTQENEYHILGFKSLGANPTPFAFNELYTALQQGTVDAQENPIELIYSQKFYEQQKYITLTNHQQQVQTWLMNGKLFDSLPKDMQKVVMDGVAVGCDAAQDYALRMEDDWKGLITNYGVKFAELTDEQYNTFKDRVTPQWDAIKNVVSPGVWDAYTAY